RHEHGRVDADLAHHVADAAGVLDAVAVAVVHAVTADAGGQHAVAEGERQPLRGVGPQQALLPRAVDELGDLGDRLEVVRVRVDDEMSVHGHRRGESIDQAFGCHACDHLPMAAEITQSYPSPELLEFPYPFFDAAREQAPVHQDPVTGFYLVFRHEDIAFALQRDDLFAGINGPIGYDGALMISATDPPDHKVG